MPGRSQCRPIMRRHASVSRTFRPAQEVDWHTVPQRVLTVRLDGSAEYQTSDGDKRLVPAGSFILFEDTHGKGHKSRHSPEEQIVIWISLPHGLDNP
jgi:quercetin dioxygenase-like cupin family protein